MGVEVIEVDAKDYEEGIEETLNKSIESKLLIKGDYVLTTYRLSPEEHTNLKIILEYFS